MAKDTEKLIRQLSLISYLMAERRPVTALEIRRDVEGYSGMNEDAFARRFYADRAELESLGIQLTVDKPVDGVAEQENYSLRPENFHLPAIAFTDEELASLQFALTLLDGEFAYAEPLRLALQQISWGRPSPLQRARPARRSRSASPARAGGHDLSQRLAKIETAIFRHKTITFDYYTMERDEVGARKVDPYHLLFQGGQFYLLGRSHERDALRVFRLSRIRGKVAYATKAEHDFKRPTDFDPRAYANRADWQFGDAVGTAEVWVSERIAWQVERHFGRFGDGRARPRTACVVLAPRYANARQLASLGARPRRARARRRARPSSSTRSPSASRCWPSATSAEPQLAAPRRAGAGRGGRRTPSPTATGAARPRSAPSASRASSRSPRSSSRPGARGERLRAEDVCERLQISDAELREDVNVLNVVNFGGGSYVLYAEVGDDGWIEVDPEPYSDNFARPARLLPVEAKALVAAIDLIGEHLPEGALTSAREKIVAALGADPMEQGLQIASAGGDDSVDRPRRLARRSPPGACCAWSTTRPTRTSSPSARSSPTRSSTAARAGTSPRFDPAKDDVRHFRLDRIKTAEVARARLRAAPRGRPRRRRRGLAAHRRGRGLAHRARVDLARARALGARGAHASPQELDRRRGRRRAALRGQGLARARGAQGGRRRRRARAARGARGRAARRRPPAGRRARLAVAEARRMAPRCTGRRCDVLPNGSRSTLACTGAPSQGRLPSKS